MLRALLAIVTTAAVAAAACTRSDLSETAAIDCAPGVRALVQNAAFCVYPGERPDACPSALPFRQSLRGFLLCSVDAEPAPELLEAALAEALRADDDAPPDAGVDADRRPRIVDAFAP
ncbi:MAG: hypothetical protein H6704_18050 [Myxococcales bacterium]|nr:hypothetical protein [Myxococcales bacterium]